MDALMLNGAPLTDAQSTVLYTNTSGDTVKISFPSGENELFHDGDVVTVSASHYNAQKKTGYRLPYDVSLTIDNVPRDISVSTV